MLCFKIEFYEILVMTNTTIICDLKDLRADLLLLFKEEWLISDEIAASIYDDVLVDYFDKFQPTIHFVVESPYVDRVYRDSYYSYFSTKLGDYNKNCIKVSLFENAIQDEDFRENDKIEKLQQHYLGFIVLRPTIPYVIGRSVINPNALKGEKFLSVTSSYPATVNGVRLTAHGFPHSSQDTETISCAETSIWAIMEYFSSRYPEYKPALPSYLYKKLKWLLIMIIRINKTAQIIERLRQNGQSFIESGPEAAARREFINEQARIVRRDTKRKERLSEISAAKVILNA